MREGVRGIRTGFRRCTTRRRPLRHIEDCQLCQDLAIVARTFRDDYARALADVRVPAPALLWWRSELRLRHDAARTAARPITLLHAFAAACAVGVALASLRIFLVRGPGVVLDQIRGLAGTVSTYLEAAVSSQGVAAAILGIGCCLMLAPIAAWLMLSED